MNSSLPGSNGALLPRSSRPVPCHPDVRMETVDRLQTQVSLNRASLETMFRDLKKATDHMRRLESGFNELSRSYLEHFDRLQSDLVCQLDVFKQQIQAVSNFGPSGEKLDDQTLEILTRNLSAVSDKANKVDGLELDMQLLKRKMLKLEDQISQVSLAPSTSQTAQSQSAHSGVTHYSTHGYPASNSRHSSQITRHSHMPELRSHTTSSSEQTQSSWEGSNSTKRSGVESHADASAKRPRLELTEPQVSGTPPSANEASRSRIESEHQYADPSTSAAHLAYRHERIDKAQYISTSREPTLESRFASPSASNLQRRGNEDSPQQYAHPDARTNLPGDPQTWVDNTKQEVLVDGQMSFKGPDGRYHRLSEHDNSRSGSFSSSALSSKDPYAHTKKTRQKPIRNSDGILIRKDGRPDMRSQSSAANLRKVHARKEGYREGGTHEDSPESIHRDGTSCAPSADGAESPSAIAFPRSDSTKSAGDHENDAHRARADSTQIDRPHTDDNEAERRPAQIHQQNSPDQIERRATEPHSINRSPHSVQAGSHESVTIAAIHQGAVNHGPERRCGNDSNKENSHLHQFPASVSIQYKQPEMSIAMLTKQEVA